MRALFFCLTWMLGGCAGLHDGSSWAWVSPVDEEPTAIRYNRADGYRYTFSFERMQLHSGYVGEQLREQLRVGVDTLGSSRPMWDCSNERFSCLRTQHFVFAIPRHELSRGISYVAEGQRFDVIGCRDDACRVADIRAVCERSEDTTCVPANGDSDEAYVMAYFTFDSAKGVTSIEFGPDARGQPDRRTALVGERGILAAPALQ